MNYIKLDTLPQICFAHVYKAKNYSNLLAVKNNCLEISYITKGSLSCTVNGHTFEAKKGDILCNTFLSPMKIISEDVHEHHTVCFSGFFSCTETPEKNYACLPFLTHPQQNGDHILSCIDEIIRQSTINPDFRLTSIGLFLCLIDLINKSNHESYSNIRYSDFQYVEKAKKYIYEHLNNHIEQKEIAKHIGISPEYLCALFKKAEGTTIMTFINRIKLEKIRTLIEKEKLKLHEAAEIYGYTDPSYVSRLYKKYFHKNIIKNNH